MKPVRSPRYLAWIRTLPCIICSSRRGVEAAHTGPRGLGQKSSDLSAIPLCYRHHRMAHDSYHRLGARRFAEVHNLDIPAIVQRLSARPIIRIECGAFVGYLNERQFVLGFVQDGIALAIKKMIHVSKQDRLVHPIAS